MNFYFSVLKDTHSRLQSKITEFNNEHTGRRHTMFIHSSSPHNYCAWNKYSANVLNIASLISQT